MPTSAALAGAAIGADEATFLINQSLLTAVGATLTRSLCTVGQILLQRALHTHLPCVDALRVEFQPTYKLEHLIDRHTVAKHTGNQFGIVPVFGIEFVAEALDGGLVAALVHKLEVVAFGAVGVHSLDNLAVVDRLGAEDTIFIIGQTGKDFIGAIVHQTHKRNPLLLVVLEADHIGFKFDGALDYIGMDFAGSNRSGFRFLLLDRHEHTRTAAVAIYCAALTAGACALIFQWTTVLGNNPNFGIVQLSTLLIRGADRNPNRTYPNREWGFGSLNLTRTFDNFRPI